MTKAWLIFALAMPGCSKPSDPYNAAAQRAVDAIEKMRGDLASRAESDVIDRDKEMAQLHVADLNQVPTIAAHRESQADIDDAMQLCIRVQMEQETQALTDAMSEREARELSGATPASTQPAVQPSNAAWADDCNAIMDKLHAASADAKKESAG